MKKTVIVTLLLSCALLFALQEKIQPKEDYDYHVALGKVASKIRDKVRKSTVAIFVERTDDPEGEGPKGKDEVKGDYWRRPEGPCTGAIIESDGYIITSRFNVSPTIKKIKVRTDDGKEYKAQVLGTDEYLDIALLKIDAKDLPVLEKIKEKDVGFGDLVFLLGRAPDPDSPTIVFGIISAKSRMNDRAYGTDAEMNFGNTGGPLVNLDGKLVAIACNIRVRPKTHWGHSSGVGFAAKIETIDKLLSRLKKGETITQEKKPWLGVMPGGSDKDGIVIMEVMENSPAEAAGLETDDVITHFDGEKVATFPELQKLINNKKVGDKVKIKFKRKVKSKWVEKEVEVTLQERPES